RAATFGCGKGCFITKKGKKMSLSIQSVAHLQGVPHLSKRALFLLCGIVLNVFCLPNLSAQSTHAPLRKGDLAYDREQYKASEKQYRVAADRDMGHPQAVYNLGNALYQQGNFEDASQRFQQAVENAPSPEKKADALHNLGNSLLKQRKYKESVQAYEQSLRLRPANPETKQNLQMAKKKLREEMQKEKEKQAQDQQNQDQQNQDQQNQDQSQDPNQSPPQDSDNQPDQSGQNPPQQPEQAPEPKPTEQQMKKEEAKRLLETAVGTEDRKNAQKYRAAQQQNKPKSNKKDW
ncbi:MAG: tetratricopeptide repeat protein, partial [Saprospiraceae bacterium]|nr:tetratricopeptide repeat protein [Saprospiraceae bacterium]